MNLFLFLLYTILNVLMKIAVDLNYLAMYMVMVLPQVFLGELQLWALANTFANTMAQKFLDEKFIPRIF